MGKIEAALQRAKELRDGGTGWSKQRERRATDQSGRDLPADSRWNELSKVELNHACMARNRITHGMKNRAGSEMAYNMLRTRLVRRMRDNNWSSLIVSSPDSNAGKTVTAINLAISISREQGPSVYLIDLDLREPSLHRYLGVSPKGELTDYLDRKCRIEDVISSTDIPRLYFALNTVAHQHSAELLTSAEMREFVADLRRKDPTGLIIYDAPPLLVTDDVLAFSPQADAVLLVVAEGETSRDDLKRSIDSLSGTNLLGVVLNKSHDVMRRSTYY